MTEGIPWVFVNSRDSQARPELIEGQLGILDLLSEEWRWVRAAGNQLL